MELRSLRTILVAGLLTAAAVVLATPPTIAENPEYCNQPGVNDPRCEPGYCDTPQGQQDPWCRDPALYCEQHPQDPICHKGPPGEPKALCVWSINGAPASPAPLVLIPRGSQPGPQAVTLDCPNHFLAGWECGIKHQELPDPTGAPLGSAPDCKYLGQVADPQKPCATKNSWLVTLPNLGTAQVFLWAHVWKDVDCDGKADDWNSHSADGACAIPNVYSPKVPPPPPTAYPQPDGVVDDCDMQHYEVQWRQTN